MGKMKVKWEDFKLYQCSKKGKVFDPLQRLSQIFMKEHKTNFN